MLQKLASFANTWSSWRISSSIQNGQTFFTKQNTDLKLLTVLPEGTILKQGKTTRERLHLKSPPLRAVSISTAVAPLPPFIGSHRGRDRPAPPFSRRGFRLCGPGLASADDCRCSLSQLSRRSALPSRSSNGLRRAATVTRSTSPCAVPTASLQVTACCSDSLDLFAGFKAAEDSPPLQAASNHHQYEPPRRFQSTPRHFRVTVAGLHYCDRLSRPRRRPSNCGFTAASSACPASGRPVVFLLLHPRPSKKPPRDR